MSISGKPKYLALIVITLLSLTACTGSQQYTFFVTLGDRISTAEDKPTSLEEAGGLLEAAKAVWTPETATPAQNAVLTELARQAQERAFYEGIIRARQAAPSNHPFLACVRNHESATAGLYQAQNPHSSASGAYQFIDSTWRNVSVRAGYSGYSRAVYAPPHVQDAVALWVYNNGGKSAWNGTGC